MAPSSCPHPVHSFAEVLGVECRGSSTLELSLKSEQLVLHTARASAIKAMVELFLSELKKASGEWGVAQVGGLHQCCMAPSLGWLILGLSAKLPQAAKGGVGSPGYVPGILGCSGENELVEGGAGGSSRTGLAGRLAVPSLAHPPACRTLATSLPCEATSLMTTASSVSTVGTSSSCCQWPLWSQVFPRGQQSADTGRAA